MKKRPQYRDLSVAQLLAANIPEADRLNTRTIGKLIERLSSFFKWCVKQQYISFNPAEGVAPQGKSRHYKAFTHEDLQAIFSPVNWKPHASYAHWLPLLGAFTGARLGELCQLSPSDVTVEDGTHVIHIKDEPDEGKTIKTEQSERLVPVAAKLIELGFLDFVDQRRRSGHQTLFPDLGGTSKASKWFTRYRKRCGVIGRGREKAFHSFRATVINLLGPREVRTEHIKELVGHDHDDITFGVYYGNTPPRELEQIIDRLDYPVDFESIRNGIVVA